MKVEQHIHGDSQRAQQAYVDRLEARVKELEARVVQLEHALEVWRVAACYPERFGQPAEWWVTGLIEFAERGSLVVR